MIFRLLLPLLFTSMPALAAVVITTDIQISGNRLEPFTPTYVIPANNLLASASLSSTVYSGGSWTTGSSGGLSVLTNGAFGTISANNADGTSGTAHPAFAAAGGSQGGESITYTFASAQDIYTLMSYGGWNDGGRDQQLYNVSYATADAPEVFHLITQVNYNPAGSSFQRATLVTITDNSGAPLATNVSAIKFEFPAVENGFTGYAELVALAPEPSRALLLIVASGAWLLRRPYSRQRHR